MKPDLVDDRQVLEKCIAGDEKTLEAFVRGSDSPSFEFPGN